MRECPSCHKAYYDDTLNFCLDDGTPLVYGERGLEPMTAIYSGSQRGDDSSMRLAKESGLKADNKSIAVLAFSNMSADPDNEFFCDGLAEELLNSLAKIGGLRVASRTSAFSFKGENASIRQIAVALGVDAVLEGSVRKSGNRLRVTVQLIDVADDRQIWSERYDREMEDIFDVQDDIAMSVAGALKVTLLVDEKAAVLKRYTNNIKAYQLFLKGRYHWYKHTPEDIRLSREYFQQAIDLDPDYAPGHAGLGEFYGLSAALGLMPPDEGWRISEKMLSRAKDLEDGLPEVHNGLAAVRLFYHRDWEGGMREIRRTIALNPKFAEVHSLYAFRLVAAGRLGDAISEGRRALELDPLSSSYQFYLGRWLYFARRFDDAIEAYNSALELAGDHARVYEAVGNVYEQNKMNDEAVAAWRQALVLVGDDELTGILDSTYAKKDFDRALRTVAEKKLERLNKRTESNEYVPAVEFVRCYIRLGENEKSLTWLEKVAEERNTFAFQIGVDPMYDGLRGDPRFRELLRKVGFPE